jgi:hypothetical protein
MNESIWYSQHMHDFFALAEAANNCSLKNGFNVCSYQMSQFNKILSKCLMSITKPVPWQQRI